MLGKKKAGLGDISFLFRRPASVRWFFPPIHMSTGLVYFRLVIIIILLALEPAKGGDMLKIAIGQGEDIDAHSAIETAIARCRIQLKDLPPQAGIVFSDIDFDHQSILDAIHHQFGEIELIGCTTGGGFSSDMGFSDDAVTLILFYSDTIQIKAGIGFDVSIDPVSAVETALQRAREDLAGPEKLCLMFPDATTGSPHAVIRALNQALGPHCPVFGSAASRHHETPAPTMQFFGRDLLEDALPILLFSGPVKFAFSVSNSWRPIGDRAVVTRSRGYEVRRIGELRALDFYRLYLGQHRSPALEFPLAVYERDLRNFIIRSPIDYHEEMGSIIFQAPIAEGTTVQLTEATRSRIIDDAKKSLHTMMANDSGSWQPSAALAFSCATRKQILGTRISEELRILKEQLPPGLPISGFHSFGEFSPLGGSRESLLHNCTLVTLLIGDQDADAAGERLRPGGWANRPPHRNRKAETMEALTRENAFLKKRLKRSEHYRQRLEVYKDQNDALMRKIHFDMHRAHLEIQHKNDLLRKSLALANEIQLNLLPHGNPSNPHFDIAGRSIFCSATGGDYYDFIPRSDDNRTQLSVAVGDVTGHGIEAALLMTTARALLRSRALMPGSMAQIIGDVNQHLTQDLYETGRFITLFLLTIDPVTCSLNWVRAGHDPAICYDPATDTFEELRGSGLAMGVELDWHYEEYRKGGLTDGQIIFLGTDGIWETHDPRGNMFGKAPVYDIIRAHATDDAEQIVETVIDNLNDFRKNAEPEDDITLIVIKVKENGHPCQR